MDWLSVVMFARRGYLLISRNKTTANLRDIVMGGPLSGLNTTPILPDDVMLMVSRSTPEQRRPTKSKFAAVRHAEL